MVVTCFHCGARHSLDVRFRGQRIKCRACGEQFDVTMPMSYQTSLDYSPPKCPKCESTETQRLISTFTAIKDWRTT